jgi:uncharacterized protein YbjT (DUF2867 family)
VDAASRQRVGHVVYLSFIGAGPAATFSHARSHGKTEQMLRESGLSWCGVRNAMYGDQMPDWFDPLGRITGPGDNGRVSFSMIEEIAESIAVLLTDETEDGRELVTVTTPESVSLAELAAPPTSRVAATSTSPPSATHGLPTVARWADQSGPSRPGFRTTTVSAAGRRTSSDTTISA